MPIGVPGCPELACWIASIASVRMVLTLNRSIAVVSDVAGRMRLLGKGTVERAVGPAGVRAMADPAATLFDNRRIVSLGSELGRTAAPGWPRWRMSPLRRVVQSVRTGARSRVSASRLRRNAGQIAGTPIAPPRGRDRFDGVRTHPFRPIRRRERTADRVSGGAGGADAGRRRSRAHRGGARSRARRELDDLADLLRRVHGESRPDARSQASRPDAVAP